MHTHTYMKVIFFKKKFGYHVRSLPWLSIILSCVLAGLTNLEASTGKTKADAPQISVC